MLAPVSNQAIHRNDGSRSPVFRRRPERRFCFPLAGPEAVSDRSMDAPIRKRGLFGSRSGCTRRGGGNEVVTGADNEAPDAAQP
jgi:hypothetical protein